MLASYKACLQNKIWVYGIITGLIYLSFSFGVNFYASKYANSSMSNYVSDIVLSNIPVFDVDGIYIYGPIIFWTFVFFLTLSKPQTIPFIIKSIAVFVFVRSIFISITHIGIFPSHLVIDAPQIFTFFTYYGDLFFSGHTGLPFLMALIFWDNKPLRIFFISSSIFFGCIVLMGHLHYSIDVLGAFFITYSIYKLSEKLFEKDKDLLDSI